MPLPPVCPQTTDEIFTPVDGVVVAINPDLASNPKLVNEDPEGKGWLVKISPAGTLWSFPDRCPTRGPSHTRTRGKLPFLLVLAEWSCCEVVTSLCTGQLVT